MSATRITLYTWSQPTLSPFHRFASQGDKKDHDSISPSPRCAFDFMENRRKEGKAKTFLPVVPTWHKPLPCRHTLRKTEKKNSRPFWRSSTEFCQLSSENFLITQGPERQESQGCWSNRGVSLAQLRPHVPIHPSSIRPPLLRRSVQGNPLFRVAGGICRKKKGPSLSHQLRKGIASLAIQTL